MLLQMKKLFKHSHKQIKPSSSVAINRQKENQRSYRHTKRTSNIATNRRKVHECSWKQTKELLANVATNRAYLEHRILQAKNPVIGSHKRTQMLNVATKRLSNKAYSECHYYQTVATGNYFHKKTINYKTLMNSGCVFADLLSN